MKSSKFRWNFKTQCKALLIGFIAVMLGNASGALADDDWRPRNGVEGLRPLKNGQPLFAFLNAQQVETAEQSQAAPEPTPLESYNDWLDQSEYKGVPRVRDGRFLLPTMLAPSIATESIGNGRTPKGFRSEDPSPAEPLPETSEYRGTQSWTPALWAAANTYSNPRYFEDRMLERHGHERCPALTPLISGARFFTTISMLPYLMTVSNPCKQESTLGYYRSGSPTPALRQRPPFERRAVLVEVAAIAGFLLAVP